jgi:hypothetical protein
LEEKRVMPIKRYNAEQIDPGGMRQTGQRWGRMVLLFKKEILG